jgi:hypothetical protein
MPLLLALVLAGLLLGYCVAVVFPWPFALSATVGGLAGLLAALILPGFAAAP